MAGVPHSKSGDWIFRATLHHSDVFAKDAFRVIVEVQVVLCLNTVCQPNSNLDQLLICYMLLIYKYIYIYVDIPQISLPSLKLT